MYVCMYKCMGHNDFVFIAFVHGIRGGILREEAIEMGATLEGAKISYLDIQSEKQLVENTKKHLQAHNLSEKDLSSSLRDLGLTRLSHNTYILYITRKTNII